MVTLYIAEKPSVARALIAVLPKPHYQKDGYFEVGNGDLVSWCIGHLIEAAPPEIYDLKYKRWTIADLPILPQKWQYQPKKTTQKQLHILMRLIHQSTQWIHVGDPDREGQLLVDEIFHYCQMPREKVAQIQRCLISDLNPKAVQLALRELKSNRDYIPLSVSALARSRADWIFGMNLSRLCTLKGRQKGVQQVLSIGRVQTPLLALVVQRDNSIAQFVSHLFYELFAFLSAPHLPSLKLKWQKNAASEAHQDEEGRLLSRPFLEQIEQNIQNQVAIIEQVERKDIKMQPPLPFNLSQLQIEMAKRKGMSAQKVLDLAQILYEKEKLITYPRSDCRYLSKRQYGDRKAVLTALHHNLPMMQTQVEQSDLNLYSPCWNDNQVSAHHAIIPTEKRADLSKLSPDLRSLYEVIARQYLVQFYPVAIFEELKIKAKIGSEWFSDQARRLKQIGWRALFAFPEDRDLKAILNAEIKKGDVLMCDKTEIVQKETTPPLPFSDATLLAAMTNIARFVKNGALKKILRETDGIGTEATRAGMIELLFKRQFLERDARTIRSTALGKRLIANLPELLTAPDMTAKWEQQLEQIYHSKLSYVDFMNAMQQELIQVMNQVNQNGFK